MRFSESCYAGMGLLSAYSFVAFISVTYIILPHYEKLYNDASNALNNAQNAYDAANADYLMTQNKIIDAHITISDAQCYLDKNQDFRYLITDYCLLAMPVIDKVNTLSNNFAIKLRFLPDSTIETMGAKSIQECNATSYSKCDTNGQNCQNATKQECHLVKYFFPRHIYKHHGATAQGLGSNVTLACGKFSYQIGVSAHLAATKTTQKSSYDQESLRINKQTRNVTFSSSIKTYLGIESATPTNSSTFNLNPNKINLNDVAEDVLESIRQQCASLKDSLKPDSHYRAIISVINKQLPLLRTELATKKALLDESTNEKNRQQKKFDMLS